MISSYFFEWKGQWIGSGAQIALTIEETHK